MPTAPLGVCPYPGCPRRSRGLCPVHLAAKHQATDARRGSRHQRGYDSKWVAFVAAFPRLLMARGILPVCGARLSGTSSPHSQCLLRGRVTLEGLHVDHDPPLEAWERSHPERVCDPHRVQLLCRLCHLKKTRAEQLDRR
jgi:hypothetical protein